MVSKRSVNDAFAVDAPKPARSTDAPQPARPADAPVDAGTPTPCREGLRRLTSPRLRLAPARLRRPGLLIPLVVLCVLAVLFITWEVAFRRLLPTESIGWHHALLTVWAGVLTAVVCTGVYFVMHRH
ncbi:MAG: hypothetical protein ACYTFA_19215, partial [Planctomycetota bacterium]